MKHAPSDRSSRPAAGTKRTRRRSGVTPAIEPLEQRHAFDAAGLPVAMWIEGDNGDDTFYQGIVDYATSVQPLESNKLLLRLADPESSDPSISANFQLTAQSRLIASILQLSQRGFTGQVALIPDFTQGETWTWNPTGGTFTDDNKWEKAYYWADHANDVLTANGSKLLISEVTIEAESSHISADPQTLQAIRDYQKTLWPLHQPRADGHLDGRRPRHPPPRCGLLRALQHV